MTVLTKVKVSKKEDEPAQTHLVEDKPEDNMEKGLAAAGEPEDEVDADTIRYLALSQRARRVNGSSICVLTGILLVFAACLLFGLFYYRQSHQVRSGRLHSWCSVPFQMDELPRTLPPSEVEVLFDKSDADPEPLQHMQPIFHEEFDIDIEANTESMFVPRFQLGLGARFFNDFNMGQTVIIPEDQTTMPFCLVLELDELSVLSPGPLAERVRRMEEDPDFLSSAVEVEEERVVITFPAMTSDMLPIASGVNRDCEGLSIFKMERRNIVKRSAEDQVAGTKFAMYGGRGVVQFNVVNMQELLKKKLE